MNNKFYVLVLPLVVGCEPPESVVTVNPEVKIRIAEQDIAEFSDGGSVRVLQIYPRQSLNVKTGSDGEGHRFVTEATLQDNYYAIVESRGMTAEGERMLVPFDSSKMVVVGDLWKLRATEHGVRFGERVTE